jgi:hypothetical protein
MVNKIGIVLENINCINEKQRELPLIKQIQSMFNRVRNKGHTSKYQLVKITASKLRQGKTDSIARQNGVRCFCIDMDDVE